MLTAALTGSGDPTFAFFLGNCNGQLSPFSDFLWTKRVKKSQKMADTDSLGWNLS